jgi:hypothetical protein
MLAISALAPAAAAPAAAARCPSGGNTVVQASSDCICEGSVPSGYEVHAIGTSGRRRIVDSGPDVDPASLALAGARISWSTPERSGAPA